MDLSLTGFAVYSAPGLARMTDRKRWEMYVGVMQREVMGGGGVVVSVAVRSVSQREHSTALRLEARR
jgi:hypothetical protein